MSIMRRCNWCQKPYDEHVPRTLPELECLRHALFVSGPAATEDRPICDSCYEQVVGSAPRLNNTSSIDVGYSNHGPSNMLLRRAVEGYLTE